MFSQKRLLPLRLFSCNKSERSLRFIHCWNLISWIFFPQTSKKSVAQFHSRPLPHRSTELLSHRFQHSSRQEVIPPGIPTVGNTKRSQVKAMNFVRQFLCQESSSWQFLNKKVCGEVDGMPMTSMTIHLESKKGLWNGQSYAPSKGTSLMLNVCI